MLVCHEHLSVYLLLLLSVYLSLLLSDTCTELGYSYSR